MIPTTGKSFHAVLVTGGTAEERLAESERILTQHFSDDPLAAAKIAAGTFEDVTYITVDEGKSEIPVRKVEDLIIIFSQKPFASTGKAAVFIDGGKMNEPAQNKLLKLLEEPAAGDVILILEESEERLLPTVRSRCVRRWLGYPKPDPDAETWEDVMELARILFFGKRTLPEAFLILSKYSSDRDSATEVLQGLEVFLLDLVVGAVAPELLTEGSPAEASAAAAIDARHRAALSKGVLIASAAQSDMAESRSRNKPALTLKRAALQMKMEAIGYA